MLAFLASHEEARITDIAAATEISEGHVRRTIDGLIRAGFLERVPVRNHNRYTVQHDAPLAPGSVSSVGQLISLIAPPGPA